MKLLFTLLLLIKTSLGFYCDFGLCETEADEYCCGNNVCCETISNWLYLWVSLAVVGTIACLIWAFRHYRKCQRRARNLTENRPLIEES